MMPTTEIELNEVQSTQNQSPKKLKPVQIVKKKADAVYTDFKSSYKQANFTPVALRPADRSVILFFFLKF